MCDVCRDGQKNIIIKVLKYKYKYSPKNVLKYKYKYSKIKVLRKYKYSIYFKYFIKVLFQVLFRK
jgi:hypothetical protein